jgi:hypothetical protein|tara:strand:+ start:100 stop:546 length:447 start_codon:yes stop_codon:yes gene_type:complete
MATLTITLTESVSLNDREQGATNSFTVSNVDEVMKRIVTCPASATTTVATFATATSTSANAIDVNDCKYIRITNLDSTNSVELAVVGAATLYQVALAAGQSHVLGSPDDLMLAEADTSPSFGTMADVASLQINPDSNAVSVELFIASA